MVEERRVLRKSRGDYALRGVLGGIAEYFGWSSLRLRIVFMLLMVLTAAFPGLLVYLSLVILMPEPKPEAEFRLQDYREQ